MQPTGDRHIDIEDRDGLWYFRCRNRRLGPYTSRDDALKAGKKILYILYLRHMHKAAHTRPAP